jgi:hypothetical protein
MIVITPKLKWRTLNTEQKKELYDIYNHKIFSQCREKFGKNWFQMALQRFINFGLCFCRKTAVYGCNGNQESFTLVSLEFKIQKFLDHLSETKERRTHIYLHDY